MTQTFSDPFGQGAGRQRLSVEETARRMLETGAEMAAESGLRVSFDLLRLEDVISRAGVARSAVYKRWPRKEQYYSELLLELAGHAHPAQAAFDMGTISVALAVGVDHGDWLQSARGRRRLVIEMCRQGALQNLQTLNSRPEWQGYMALHATLVALPENEFRDALQSALRNSEENFFNKMGTFYTEMIKLLGYQIKPSIDAATTSDMATIGGAVVIGLALTSGAVPKLVEKRFTADPFDAGEVQEWSYPSIGFTSIVLSFIEPDPKIDWDKSRIESAGAAVLRMHETLAPVATDKSTEGKF